MVGTSHPADRCRDPEANPLSPALGEERMARHAKMFAAKRALAEAETAYRAILAERHKVQEVLAALLPKMPRHGTPMR